MGSDRGAAGGHAKPPSRRPRHRNLGSEVELRPRPDVRVVQPENGLPPPTLGERIDFWCEGCDHAADATYTNKYGPPTRWVIGSPNRVRCPGEGECLARIAEQGSTVLGRHVGSAELLDNPRPILGALPGARARSGGHPPERNGNGPRSKTSGPRRFASCGYDARRERPRLGGTCGGAGSTSETSTSDSPLIADMTRSPHVAIRAAKS